VCGIVGFVNKKRGSEKDLESLKGMMQLQAHRGPDDTGFAVIDRAANNISMDEEINSSNEVSDKQDLFFGFNRLSILDVSNNGHQPMHNKEAGVVFMLNGEIYNAFDYRSELRQKGFIFKSETDTEIALNLYLEYGLEGMLSRLNGMFAIAIYDSRSQKTILIRDRFGVKPLYFLNTEDQFAFSSEIKSFKALPGFEFELDKTHFNEFLFFRNIINRTLYKNIVNLEPGSYLVVNHKNQLLTVRYFDIAEMKADSINPTGNVSGLESEVKNAVERQMVSDVKLGCQLSGGVDSSLVSFFASEHLTKGQLETISIIPQAKGFSEEEYIDVVFNKLRLKAHKYPLDANYYFHNLEKASWHFEHPVNHPNTIGIYLLSQQAKKHVTVLLSGEGADEIFGGYSRFESYHTLLDRLKMLASRAKKDKGNILDLIPYFVNQDAQMICASSFTSIVAIQSIYPDFDFWQGMNWRMKKMNSITGSRLARQRKYEMITYLPDLLMRQDKMSMAHSIENRVPFLDNHLAEYALSLKDEDLMGASNKPIGKYLLKKLTANKFSDDFAFRRKKGFGIPLKHFFKSNYFHERWKDQWRNDIRNTGIFDIKPLDRWIKNLDKCNVSQIDSLWLALSTQIWYNLYLQK